MPTAVPNSTVDLTVAASLQQAERALWRRLQESEALAAIGRALNETLEWERILQLIVESAQHIIPQVERAVIHLLAADEEILRAVAVAGLTPLSASSLTMRSGEGIAGRVLADGIAINVGDILADSRYLPGNFAPDFRSLLVVPVQNRMQRFGALSVMSAAPHNFSADDERLLAQLGVQAALAITNARLYETERQQRALTERRANEFAALYETIRDLATQTDLTVLLQTIVDRAKTLLQASAGGIYLYDATRDDLEFVTARDALTPLGTRITIGRGLAGRVAQTRQPLRVDDYQSWPHRLPDFADISYGALLEVPMLYSGELVGVIVVSEGQGSSRRFSDDDERLLCMLAGHAASAVHNARLLMRERQRLQAALAMQHVTEAISAQLKLSDLLLAVVEAIAEITHYQQVTVYLSEAQGLRLQAQRGYAPEHVLALIPHGQGVSGRALRTQRPLLAPDVTRDPDYVIADPAVRSLMAVPIGVAPHLHGVLMVESRAAKPLDQDDLQWLIGVGQQLTVAMENARLYMELERTLQKEQQMRAQLVQADKLSIMGRMVATVAHELNNPLQIVKTSLALLQTDKSPDSSDYALLEMSAAATQQLVNLVTQLRSFYRRSGVELSEHVYLADVLSEVQTLTKAHLSKHRVAWVYTPPAQPLLVAGNAEQLRQVFINLCFNAMEAMQPNGGNITVSLKRSLEDGMVGVEFCDVGCGIASENLSRLFEPFFTTKETGVGLGLAICYDIVQKHGGHIAVASELGKGATFTVWLPLAQAE
jgi:signal transduction histidine kinase